MSLTFCEMARALGGDASHCRSQRDATHDAAYSRTVLVVLAGECLPRDHKRRRMIQLYDVQIRSALVFLVGGFVWLMVSILFFSLVFSPHPPLLSGFWFLILPPACKRLLPPAQLPPSLPGKTIPEPGLVALSSFVLKLLKATPLITPDRPPRLGGESTSGAGQSHKPSTAARLLLARSFGSHMASHTPPVVGPCFRRNLVSCGYGRD